MSYQPTTHPTPEARPRRVRRRHRALAAVVPLVALAAACAGASAAPAESHAGHKMSTEDRVAATRASAGFQDVAVAEDAGYASSLGTLGCFQDPELGGMGIHYIDDDLLDATLDITKPEALVYELDASGEVTGLVAHEDWNPAVRLCPAGVPIFGTDLPAP